jgi:hypothetical protein
VRDSINENHLEVFSVNSSPLYVTDVPSTPLQSGLPNTLSFDFLPNNDLYTQYADANVEGTMPPVLINPGKKINNGIIEPGQGFTIEAAFKARDVSQFQAIIAKEGRPAFDDNPATMDFIENLPTLALKTRGDTGVLQVEQFDAAGNLVQVSSGSPLVTNQWYQTAVVNTGSELMLFLDSNDGSGYQLQGTVAVDGALYQGENPEAPDWSNSWTIGRGQFGGGATDFFNGFIDEVRLSNRALAPYEFLFSPDASAMLVGDYNDDGVVDAADYVVWRNNVGGAGLPNDPTPNSVDANDYLNWKATFGMMASPGLAAAAVPEPGSLGLCGLGLAALLAWRRRAANY